MTPESLPRGDPDALRGTIAAHPFCSGFPAEHVIALTDGAMVATVPAGSFVFQRGMPASAFHLITDGSVALEIAAPGHEPLTLETLHAGDALGWSWLFPERGWQFDAHCVTDVTTVAIDATHLRRLVDQDATFGRDLVMRIGRVVVDRLLHARAQLADIHSHDHR